MFDMCMRRTSLRIISRTVRTAFRLCIPPSQNVLRTTHATVKISCVKEDLLSTFCFTCHEMLACLPERLIHIEESFIYHAILSEVQHIPDRPYNFVFGVLVRMTELKKLTLNCHLGYPGFLTETMPSEPNRTTAFISEVQILNSPSRSLCANSGQLLCGRQALKH